MHNSVHSIVDSNSNLLGTGFVIESGTDYSIILTCGHVVDEKNEIFIDENPVEVIDNQYHKGVDLAFLKIAKSFPALELGTDCSGEITVDVYGYSEFGTNIKFEPINNINVKCNVSFRDQARNVDIKSIKLQPSESIGCGYSGSPVICKITDKVLGIVHIQTGDENNYAIASQEILKAYKPNPSIKNVKNYKSFKKKPLKCITENNLILIENQLKKDLENALTSYSSQPNIWVEPSIFSEQENRDNYSSENIKLEPEELIDSPSDTVIRARPQYGLTSLARYLVYQAWIKDSKPSYWIYVDAKEVKPYRQEIQKYINKKLAASSLQITDVECIVIDELSKDIKDGEKIILKFKEEYPEIPLITMVTLVANSLVNEGINIPEDYGFRELYLWSLRREDVRKYVISYNQNSYIADDNIVLNKMVSDLEVLNIPRTPLNCLTLLKVSESGFDDTPVNRTELIRRVLFLLFNLDHIPTYKSKPDLKDTEFVLGYFAESLIRQKEYIFSRKNFLMTLKQFCQSQELDLDVDVIFDVLFANNIIVRRREDFSFKFSYWIFYFAAHRMYHSVEFTTFIFSDMNYSNYPEIIEFYTGIDRSRNNAISLLTKDLNELREFIVEKIGITAELDIYSNARWNPTEEQLKQIHEEVSEDVENSKLPEIVKDRYADRDYDPIKPLDQSVKQLIKELSLPQLIETTRACSIALRNSDFVEKEQKHKLLKEITESWVLISKIVLILAPMISERGYATIDGAHFFIGQGFGKNSEERFNKIISLIPFNIAKWYRDDIFSKKMGPMLYKYIENSDNSLINHFLSLIIINKRPNNWRDFIEKVIRSEHKNSYYLSDIQRQLMSEFRYSYMEQKSLKEVEELTKKTIAKHTLGIKNPTNTALNKIKSKGNFNLPERKVID